SRGCARTPRTDRPAWASSSSTSAATRACASTTSCGGSASEASGPAGDPRGRRRPAPASSERDVVAARRAVRRRAVVEATPGSASASAVPRRAEELHGLGMDLGGLALGAVLVLPVPGAQRALDVDGAALAQVLRAQLGRLAPGHHAVPLGALLAV